MQSEWEEAQLWRSGSYIKRHLPHTIISTGFQDPQPGNRSGGGKWAPRGGGERRGSPVGQRFSKGRARRRGQGCVEAQGLKSPGAAALWALGGPGAAEGGGGEAPGKRRPRGLPGRTRRPPAVAGQGGGGARRPGGEQGLGGLQGRALQFAEARGARRAGGRTGGRGPWGSASAAARPLLFCTEEDAPGPPSPDPGAEVSPSCSAGGAGGGRRLWVPRDAAATATAAACCPAPGGVQRGLDPERGGRSPGWRCVGGGWRGWQPHDTDRRPQLAAAARADRNLKARNRARRGRSERGAGRGGASGRPTSGNPLRAVHTLSNRSVS